MAIQELIGHAKIGNANFSHWSGMPIITGQHRVVFVPQSIFDSWEAYCECGEWAASASAWDYPAKDDAISALSEAHRNHKKKKE